MNPDTQKIDVQSIREVGIYLGNLNEKIDKLQFAQEKTNEKIDSLGISLVTQIEFQPVKKQHEKNTLDISDLKERWDTFWGKVLGATAVIGAVFAILSLLINHYWK